MKIISDWQTCFKREDSKADLTLDCPAVYHYVTLITSLSWCKMNLQSTKTLYGLRTCSFWSLVYHSVIWTWSRIMIWESAVYQGLLVYGSVVYQGVWTRVLFNIFSANHFAFLQRCQSFRHQSFRQVLCHCGSWHCPSLFFVQGTFKMKAF